MIPGFRKNSTWRNFFKGPIPSVPKELIEYLSRDDVITTEGIFRRSSSTQMIRDSLAFYNQGKMLPNINDPILASALLKMFFRGLPQPLIPSSCISYMDEIKIAEPNQKIVMLRTLLNERIPVDHRALVNYLFGFLHRVTQHEVSNKMGSTQIAIVFGPTICWPDDPSETINSIQQINNMIKWTLDHYEHIRP